jgi:hypothetical protein
MSSLKHEFSELTQMFTENGIQGILLIILEDLDKGTMSLNNLRDKYKEMYMELCERHVERLKKTYFSNIAD